MSDVRFVCSNKACATTQRGGDGVQWWRREVYHAAKSGMSTYCGRDCSEWLRMDAVPLSQAITDDSLCAICKAKITPHTA